MESYPMFLGRRNQYFENDYTTKCNLQIQCDLYQLTNGIFTKLEHNFSQIIWHHIRPQIAKVLSMKKNGAGGISLPDLRFTAKLQSSRQHCSVAKGEM